MDATSLPCSPKCVVMEITCPQNFGGMNNVLVDKEALCRLSGAHARLRQLEDLWLDDMVRQFLSFF